MRKYGMLYSSIKYWQTQSRSLMLMTGTRAHVSMGNRYREHYPTMSAREIGHLAIQLAAVNLEIEYL